MEATITNTSTIVRRNDSTLRAQLPSTFLQCTRCKGFILNETSTSKRIHNVKCLSSAIETIKLLEGDNYEIFQGFLQTSFPGVTVTLSKLHADYKAHGTNRKTLENAIIIDNEGGPERSRQLDTENITNASEQDYPENKISAKKGPGRPRKLSTENLTTASSGQHQFEGKKISVKKGPGRPPKLGTENLPTAFFGQDQFEEKSIPVKKGPGRPRKLSTENLTTASSGQDQFECKSISVKKGPGRPRKLSTENLTTASSGQYQFEDKRISMKKGPGRPRKLDTKNLTTASSRQHQFEGKKISVKRGPARPRKLGTENLPTAFFGQDQFEEKSIPVKKGPGRPRKLVTENLTTASSGQDQFECKSISVKKGPGRPRKLSTENLTTASSGQYQFEDKRISMKKGPGRPRKLDTKNLTTASTGHENKRIVGKSGLGRFRLGTQSPISSGNQPKHKISGKRAPGRPRKLKAKDREDEARGSCEDKSKNKLITCKRSPGRPRKLDTEALSQLGTGRFFSQNKSTVRKRRCGRPHSLITPNLASHILKNKIVIIGKRRRGRPRGRRNGQVAGVIKDSVCSKKSYMRVKGNENISGNHYSQNEQSNIIGKTSKLTSHSDVDGENSTAFDGNLKSHTEKLKNCLTNDKSCRPRWNRSGVEVSNIIEESSRCSRNSYLKANAKFKEILGGDSSDESGCETSNITATMGKRARKRSFDDEDFAAPDEGLNLDSQDNQSEIGQASGKRKETRGRKRKYKTPLTNREKYLMFKKKYSLERIRSPNGAIGVIKYDSGTLPVKDLSTKEKYFRFSKRTECAICKETVKAFYLEMHTTHFHSEGHDKDNCDCALHHCRAIDKAKIAEERERAKKLKNSPCAICGKFIKDMKRHLDIHARSKGIVKKTFPRNLQCIVCQKYFSTQTSLKTHFIAFHVVATPFVCKFTGCNYKAGMYCHLERHVGMHIRENKIKCKGCGISLKTFAALVRHRLTCKGNNSNFVKRFTGLRRIKQTNFANFSTEPSPVCASENVKRESTIDLGSIHLYDKIIETDKGPIHLKGEHLESFPETSKFISEEDGSNASLQTETATVQNGNTNFKAANLNKESDESESEDSENDWEWDEAKIREAINKKILSWNDKLLDCSYINSIIQQDPLFQKLEIENVEFAKIILRDGGRKNYFFVNKTSRTFNHRCDVCTKVFRRSWALVRHKEENVCRFLKDVNGTASDEPQGAIVNEIGATESIPNTDGHSMSFMCAGCGFQSNSAKELEIHMKTSAIHTTQHWRKGRTLHCPKKCGACFRTIKELNEHIDELHLTQPKVKCPHCPRRYANVKRMKMHAYLFHSGRPTVSCTKCGKRFILKENCEKHEVTCKLENRRPKCQQCNEHFSCLNSLKRHVRLVHVRKTDSNTGRSSNSKRVEGGMATNGAAAVKTSAPQTFDDDDNSMILGI